MAETPVVIKVAYRNDEGVVGQLVDEVSEDVAGHELDGRDRRHLKRYPTVYIIRAKDAVRGRGGHGSQAEELVVYVGETNSIERRTVEHYSDETSYKTESNRRKWRVINHADDASMYVIAHSHFNKSLTLDLENTFMSYILASGAQRVSLVNSRGNPQDDYYTRKELPRLTSQIWRKLNGDDPELFPAESIIRDSAIFKASPFHCLGPEQREAEGTILEQVKAALGSDAQPGGALILVEGVAGTGKTVLLSHLFYRLQNEFAELGTRDYEEDESSAREKGSAVLLVNHNEQVTVYNSIMLRLGLQGKSGVVVMKPTEFINKHSEPGHGKGLDRQDFPADPVDVALIDEAHLLLTAGNQSYRGSRNMLIDVMRRARVVVAVYDPNQVLRKEQEIGREMRDLLFPKGRFDGGKTVGLKRTVQIGPADCRVTNIMLEQQYRIDACEEIVAWIDDFAAGRGIGPIPKDSPADGHQPYEIKVFDSPFELQRAVEDKAITFDSSGRMVDDTDHGLSRVLATYDWEYKDGKAPAEGETWNVEIVQEGVGWVSADEDPLLDERREELRAQGRLFSMPWNYQLKHEPGEDVRGKSWAEQDHTLGECGSTYTIQGFDLNFAGVIVGPSVEYRDGKVVFNKNKSKNSKAIDGSDRPEENLRNELNVLLKRGVHGLYIFAVDEGLRNHLKKMATEGTRAALTET